jgi:hypothetical protein
MNKKILIVLGIALFSLDINAKGGGSWGGDKTINKYGKKNIISNSERKSSTFNSANICQKNIYIDTLLSYRVKDTFWGLNRTFKKGYATIKVTLGNDLKKCKRALFNVPYLHMDQNDGGPRGGKDVKHIDGKNISYLKLILGKYGMDSSVKYEVVFKDGIKNITRLGL